MKMENQDNTGSAVLMSQTEAAKYLGTTIGTLNSWRHYGKQKIPFVRWGKCIRYRKADLDIWIASQTENKVEGA
jgi:excisionase family DNA binding protein